MLVERLREVRALLAFTRIESKGDFADAAYVDDGRETPLSRQSPIWLPASEVRGEGLFLRLKESVLQAWESRSEVRRLEREFFESHKEWRRLRRQQPLEAGFPGIRFVLVHSIAHALMRQIALECGYTSASVRERLYCRSAGPGTRSDGGHPDLHGGFRQRRDAWRSRAAWPAGHARAARSSTRWSRCGSVLPIPSARSTHRSPTAAVCMAPVVTPVCLLLRPRASAAIGFSTEPHL